MTSKTTLYGIQKGLVRKLSLFDKTKKNLLKSLFSEDEIKIITNKIMKLCI